jgi:hypothetical protein
MVYPRAVSLWSGLVFRGMRAASRQAIRATVDDSMSWASSRQQLYRAGRGHLRNQTNAKTGSDHHVVEAGGQGFGLVCTCLLACSLLNRPATAAPSGERNRSRNRPLDQRARYNRTVTCYHQQTNKSVIPRQARELSHRTKVPSITHRYIRGPHNRLPRSSLRAGDPIVMNSRRPDISSVLHDDKSPRIRHMVGR